MIHQTTLLNPFIILIFTLSILLLLPLNAAAQHSGELASNIHYSLLNDRFGTPQKPSTSSFTHGVGAKISVLLPIDDFFSLFSSFDFTYQFAQIPTQQSQFYQANLGFRYTIDLFQYVPYLELSMGPAFIHRNYDAKLHKMAKNGFSTQAQGLLTLGINYRINRSFSAGLTFSYRLFFTPLFKFPSQLMAGVKGTWHFDWGF